jgi:hypothetical protein
LSPLFGSLTSARPTLFRGVALTSVETRRSIASFPKHALGVVRFFQPIQWPLTASVGPQQVMRPYSDFFRIGKRETAVRAEKAEAVSLFSTQRALVCSGALDPQLLDQLAAACNRVAFVPEVIKDLGHRWIERPSIVGAAVEVAVNRPVFHTWLAEVSGCGPGIKLEGRLVETRAGGVDGLDWHDDRMPGAKLGMTLHLRDCAYQGGAFELRDKTTKDVLFRHAEARAGDMVIFDVSDRYEHRVMGVESGEPRLVFTGWFFNRSA